MNRLLLRSLNSPLLLLIALITMAIQSSLFSWWPMSLFQPEILLLFIIWIALRREFLEGGVLTLLLAYFSEIHSSAPQGTFLFTYMLTYLGLRGAVRILVLSGLSSIISLTLITSVLWKILCFIFLHLLGGSTQAWRHMLLAVFPSSLINTLLAVWVYPTLEKFDNATYKKPGREHALDEDLLLEEEIF